MLTDKEKKAIASCRKLYGGRLGLRILAWYFVLFLSSTWILIGEMQTMQSTVIGEMMTMHKYVDNELRYEIRHPEQVISVETLRDIHEIYYRRLLSLIPYILISALVLFGFLLGLTSKWWLKIVDKLSSEERAVDCYINLP